MSKLLVTTAALAMAATTAVAEQYATITNVKPNYRTEQIRTPIQRCSTVDVPIYGNVGGGSGASSSDILGGMIIGGLLGGTASGKDSGAAAGAVIGGLIANDNANKQKQGIVGYQQQQQCTTDYQVETVNTLKNYTILYEWNGVRGKSYTYNNYQVGDRIPINVSIKAR